MTHSVHNLQGCHYRYTGIRGQLSPPLFALIPPRTLMLHSSKGIHFLHLLLYSMPLTPDNYPGGIRATAAQPSLARIPTQMMAADTAAANSEPGTALCAKLSATFMEALTIC